MEYTRPQIEFVGAKEAYEEAINAFKKVEPTAHSIAESFISEKNLDIDRVTTKGSSGSDTIKHLAERLGKVNIKENENEYEIRKRINSILN